MSSAIWTVLTGWRPTASGPTIWADLRRQRGEREAKYPDEAMGAVIRAVLRSHNLSEATELHGLGIAAGELRRPADGSVT